jgi:1,4-dihydroxy-2-naphthoate octaprenyltransferase
VSTTFEKLYAWLALSRPPFHSVGVLPFILGGVLAWRQKGAFRWDIFAWGTVGVVLVMLATYYAGEYWDYVEDSLAAHSNPSRFAGGSRVLQRGLLPRLSNGALDHLVLRLGLAGWVLLFHAAATLGEHGFR